MTTSEALAGVLPVLATPFTDDGAIDEPSLRRLVERVVADGADAIVYPTPASEIGTLSPEERRIMVEAVLDAAAGRVPVIAGVAADSPAEAMKAAAGHDPRIGGIILMPGAALKKDAEALAAMCAAAGESFRVPVILSGAGLTIDAICGALEAASAIAYVKEESPSTRITELAAKAPTTLRGIFGGAGSRQITMELARGVIGAIPSCESVRDHAAIHAAWRAGDIAAARARYERLLPLLTFLGMSRGAGVKEVLRRRGVIASAAIREAGPALDSYDHRELGELLAHVERARRDAPNSEPESPTES